MLPPHSKVSDTPPFWLCSIVLLSFLSNLTSENGDFIGTSSGKRKRVILSIETNMEITNFFSSRVLNTGQ